MKLTMTVKPTEEEIAQLQLLALEILPCWAQVGLARLRSIEQARASAAEPVGWVNGAMIEARERMPLLHYTPTQHFDTPVYFSPSPYVPPATGISRTADGLSLAFVADCLRQYAEILRNGLIDGAGHYFPVDIDEAADGVEKLELHRDDGWIVTSGDGKQFRLWKDGLPAWTDERAEATRYARRADAEAVHAEDEDAWCVVPYNIGKEEGGENARES